MQFCLEPLCLGTIQTLNIAQKVRLKLSKTHENMCMYQDQKLCEFLSSTTWVACSRDYSVMECSAEGNLPSTQTYNWQYFHCHFHHNWPYIYNFGFDQSDNTYYAFIIIGKVYHSTLTFSMLCKKYTFRFHFYFHHGCTLLLLKHLSDPRWGWF